MAVGFLEENIKDLTNLSRERLRSDFNAFSSELQNTQA